MNKFVVMKNILVFLLLLPLITNAQDREIEKIVKQIDFEQDTVKAVFDWVTDNIRYDVDLLEKVKLNGIENIKLDNDKSLRIKNVIKTRKGVCQHYSELFDAIMQQLGYQSVVISGYTRSPVTRKINPIGHAWNAVKVNNKWILIDATWGAGYVTEDNKFKKVYKPEYYNVPATELIFSHIPYNPLWQLLKQSVTYEAFDKLEIKKANLSGLTKYKNIDQFLQLKEIDQIGEALNQSNKMKNPNALVQRWQDIKAQHLQVAYRNSMVEVYNAASEIMRNATTKFNDYVYAKNNRFNNAKWTKAFTKEYMTALLNEAEAAHQKFTSVKVNDPTLSSDLTATLRNTTSFIKLVKKELSFIDSKWPKSN